MKIKDYKCRCGQDDFFFADKGNQTGIYCSYCGKWLKWADKDEQNLRMKQEPSREFAKWVASEIFDELWEYNKDAFDELACRKLAKLGIVRAKGDEWELVETQESEK